MKLINESIEDTNMDSNLCMNTFWMTTNKLQNTHLPSEHWSMPQLFEILGMNDGSNIKNNDPNE